MKNFVSEGNSVAWTNGTGSAVVSGQVVAMSHTLGVAAVDIADGESGTVYIEGVFSVPKVSAAVFAAGEKLVWDSSAGEFDDSSATPASGDVTGGAIAAAPGAASETVCTVKLTPGNATLA